MLELAIIVFAEIWLTAILLLVSSNEIAVKNAWMAACKLSKFWLEVDILELKLESDKSLIFVKLE
jgi:uncharacterized protein (DUF1499 family)